MPDFQIDSEFPKDELAYPHFSFIISMSDAAAEFFSMGTYYLNLFIRKIPFVLNHIYQTLLEFQRWYKVKVHVINITCYIW